MKKTISILLMLMFCCTFVSAWMPEGLIQSRIEFEGFKESWINEPTQDRVRLVEQTMSRIRSQDQQRLMNFTNLEFKENLNGNLIMEGEVKTKFMGMFNVRRRFSYQVTEEGNLVRQNRFWDFLFKKPLIQTN